jgi:hypothetical protein
MMKKTTSIFTLVLAAMFASCVTSKPSSEMATENASESDVISTDQQGKPVVPSFYTLKEGVKVQYAAPLPNKTEIMVNWTYSDGGKKTQEGFRGWDFDHDGRFEMLEVLDPNGKPTMWAYDFNADGVIDFVQKTEAPPKLLETTSGKQGGQTTESNPDTVQAH